MEQRPLVVLMFVLLAVTSGHKLGVRSDSEFSVDDLRRAISDILNPFNDVEEDLLPGKRKGEDEDSEETYGADENDESYLPGKEEENYPSDDDDGQGSDARELTARDINEFEELYSLGEADLERRNVDDDDEDEDDDEDDEKPKVEIVKRKQGGKDEGCQKYPCLIFEDNFDTFDFSVWQHEITAGGGGNGEFQVYWNNRSNSYVRDGILYIKPTLTADRKGESFLSKGTLNLWGSAPANQCTGNHFDGCKKQGNKNKILPPIQSARIRTSNSFSFLHGRMEVEAQMPKGDWLWPAVWLLPKYNEYGNWPASGEIDLVESRGNANLTKPTGEQMGNAHTRTTLIWGPNWKQTRGYMTTKCKDGNFAEGFHKYSMDWSAKKIVLSVDDEVMVKLKRKTGGLWKKGKFDTKQPDWENPWRYGTELAPFDKEFFILINVAVGGTNGFFGDNYVNGDGPKPWKNRSPTAARDFWQGKDQWYPTWNPYKNNGEDAALKVNYVRVWKTKR